MDVLVNAKLIFQNQNVMILIMPEYPDYLLIAQLMGHPPSVWHKQLEYLWQPFHNPQSHQICLLVLLLPAMQKIKLFCNLTMDMLKGQTFFAAKQSKPTFLSDIIILNAW